MLLPQHASIIHHCLPPDDVRMIETCCGNNIGRGEELLHWRTHNCFVNSTACRMLLKWCQVQEIAFYSCWTFFFSLADIWQFITVPKEAFLSKISQEIPDLSSNHVSPHSITIALQLASLSECLQTHTISEFQNPLYNTPMQNSCKM
jgi:hypothetical protein